MSASSQPISSNTTSLNSAIPSFVSRFGIARTNRFVANIVPPRTLNVPYLSGIEIEAAEMPAISIQTSEFQYDQSPRIAIPLLRNPQGQTNLTIRLDEQHEYRLVFTEWIESVIRRPQNVFSFTGYSKNYYNQYVGSVQIFQLGIGGKITAGISLLNAYPISAEALRYDWGENDQYHRLSVQFAYFDYHEIIV